MNKDNDLTFTALRCKDIVNSTDGKRLGKAVDIVFDTSSGRVKGIVAPFSKKSWCGKGQDIFIPFKCILKFGEDIVLVDLNGIQKDPPPIPPRVPFTADGCVTGSDCISASPAPPVGKPDCDLKCEKCMLFDCAYRWKDN